MRTSNVTGKLIRNTTQSTISGQLLQRYSPRTFDDFYVLTSDSTKFKLVIHTGKLNYQTRQTSFE